MAFLDGLIAAATEDQDDARPLYPWMKRGFPGTPPMFPQTYNPPPAATMPAGRPPAPPAPTPSTIPGSPLEAVPVGPAATAAAPPAVGSGAPLQPVSLGPTAQPIAPQSAVSALAASKPPELHGWKSVVDTIARAMPASRMVEEAIPGTPGNYKAEVRPLLEKRAEEEAKNNAAGLAGQKDAATIARDEAEAANLNSEAAARANPKAKTHPILINGADGEPVPALQNMLTGEITDDTGAAIPNARVWEKTTTPKEDKILGHTTAELKGEMAANPALYPGGWMDGAAGFKNQKAAAMALDKAKADADRAPKDTSARDASRSDRSYQFNAKELDEERKPLEATMSKISAATSNIDLKSPQADALLAPQILSLAAGGTGSGLRMNEAEIARIVGGRTVWESIKASANKWSTDPSHPQIPEAQRTQMVQILQAAAQKGTLKSSILEWGDQALVNSDDPKEQRQIVATARKLMTAVDEGKRVQRNKTTGEFRIAPGE